MSNVALSEIDDDPGDHILFERSADDSGARSKDASRFRLDTQNDALNYVDEQVEALDQWAKAQGVRTPREDYLELQSEITLHVKETSRIEPRDFQLIMQVAPLVDCESHRSRMSNDSLMERHHVAESNPDNGLVCRSCETVHGPQHAIAVRSIVWLKRKAIVDEKFVDILTFIPDCIFDVFHAPAEWKIDSFGVFSSKRNRAVTKSLIERNPKLFQNTGRQTSDFWREFMPQSYFDDLLSGLWVGMGDNVIFARLADRLTNRFKLGDAFFSAID
jgi:hypothetical protein